MGVKPVASIVSEVFCRGYFSAEGISLQGTFLCRGHFSAGGISPQRASKEVFCRGHRFSAEGNTEIVVNNSHASDFHGSPCATNLMFFNIPQRWVTLI